MVLKRIVFYIAIILLGVVLGANVYNSVVDAPNWGAAIPESLVTAKHYAAAANPGTFFRAFGPAAQAACLLALIFGWRSGGRVRVLAGIAFVLIVFGDVLTFTYFYPRNAIMFGRDIQTVEAQQTAWHEWSLMNHVRSLLVVAALICQLTALSRMERQTKH